MKKPKITVQILSEQNGYSAITTVQQHFIATQGETLDELKNNVLEAIQLTFQDSFTYSMSDIIFEMDVQSLLEYFPINVSAFAGYVGINKSLLAQYANGSKKPAHKQAKRILHGIQKLGSELSAIRLS